MDQPKSETNTSLVTAVSQEETNGEKKKKKRTKSGKKKRRQQQEDPFNLPGVSKVVIGPETQKFIGMIVGEHITAEKPWKLVRKDAFEDHMDMHEEDSEFLPLKDQIVEFKREEVLIGYIPDESREYDEFYICLTEAAQDQVSAVIEKQRQEQEDRLNNAINRRIGRWKSLGSETEVDDEIIKNNRPLLEVEVETEYPIMSSKIHFKLRKAEDVRDGYAEILPSEPEPFINVYRKRIDASIQATPLFRPADAQTICTYPKNAYTQYEYECTFDTNPTAACQESIHDYISSHMDRISDYLVVNGSINLYENDYAHLIDSASFGAQYDVCSWTEYMSFNDINICKDKMVAAIAWHPIWTGIVAIAYADVAPNVWRTGPPMQDDVNRAVHGTNPVLIWSFVDALHPKLILEASREVLALAFCPWDENILIGGCLNGQIIIWDIRNKLKHVEEEEILTTEQQNYRNIMNSMMKWMKNIHDIKIVTAAAVSDIEYSHRGPIRAIQFISPYWEVSKSGQLREVPEDRTDTTFHFITCSADGTIHIWDLLARPTINPGAFRPQRKLKRLKKRPSALTVDVSPFRSLNRILKPIFRINVPHPSNNNKKLPIASINMKFGEVKYTGLDLDLLKRVSVTERLTYTPILMRPSFPAESEFCAGSPEGDFFIASWEGFDYNTGEVVNSQNCNFELLAKYHDGPLVAISRSLTKDLLLTVGGKVFAVWRDDYKTKPVFWRRSKTRYTHGCWNQCRNAIIKLTRVDGYIEMWHLLNQSDAFTLEQNISSQVITGSFTHARKLSKSVIGLADSIGSFRIFYHPLIPEKDDEAEVAALVKFFDREVTRKKELAIWQTEWVSKHASWIKEQQTEALLAQEKKVKEEEEEKQKVEVEQALLEKETAKTVAKQMRAPPGQYSQWAREQWNKREEERMNKVLLAKKHLDKEVLQKQHVPIKKYEEERKKKKQKQEERLGEADKIFNETVAMLFPDVIKEKPPPPPDPYAGGDSMEAKKAALTEYEALEREMRQYVEDNPFTYKFDWKEVIQAGRQRRRLLDVYQPKTTHKDRHQDYKEIRRALEEEESKAAKAAKANIQEVQLQQPLEGESEITDASVDVTVEEDGGGITDYGVTSPE